MKGVRTDKNDLGEVTGTTEVSFDVNVLTARFETADQISAFGGGDGVLRSFYDTNMPLLMIGTVKNDLFESLQAAGQSAGTSYGFNVFEVSKGSQYTIFLLTEERFWGFQQGRNRDDRQRHRKLQDQRDVVIPPPKRQNARQPGFTPGCLLLYPPAASEGPETPDEAPESRNSGGDGNDPGRTDIHSGVFPNAEAREDKTKNGRKRALRTFPTACGICGNKRI